MRARLRFFFSPSRAKTRAMACASGSISSGGDERVEQLRLVGHGAQAAADVHLEAALLLAVFAALDGDQAQVVQIRQAAGVLRAAAERRLELAAEILAVGMAQQEFGQRAGIGRDVERFIRANARRRGRP